MRQKNAVTRPTTTCAPIAVGLFVRGRGISSAKCKTQSGVLTAYAPFSIPMRKAKPSLVYPDHNEVCDEHMPALSVVRVE